MNLQNPILFYFYLIYFSFIVKNEKIAINSYTTTTSLHCMVQVNG